MYSLFLRGPQSISQMYLIKPCNISDLSWKITEECNRERYPWYRILFVPCYEILSKGQGQNAAQTYLALQVSLVKAHQVL